MAEAWFFVPMLMVYRDNVTIVVDNGQTTQVNLGWTRYCAIMDYDTQIAANGGQRSHFAEVGAGWAVVKVAGPQAGLDWLANRPNFSKFPQRPLGTALADLTAGERGELRDIALAVGFTTAQLANLNGATTYREALKRLLRRRRRPIGYDELLGEVAYEPFDWVNVAGFGVATKSLGSLTAQQRQALRDEALAAGRTQEEIDAFIGAARNWAAIRLYEVLTFITFDWTAVPRWGVLAAVFGKTEADLRFSNLEIDELDSEVSG